MKSKELLGVLCQVLTDDPKYEITRLDEQQIEAVRYLSEETRATIDAIKTNMASVVKFHSLKGIKVELPCNDAFCAVKIELRKTEYEERPYIVIKDYHFWEEFIFAYDAEKKSLEPSLTQSPNSTIIVHEDNSIYRVYKDKCYPCSVKYLKWLPEKIQEILLEPHSGNSCFYKDMINDCFYPPIPLFGLRKYYNKKDYLEKTFKVSLPKTANKYPFNVLYAISCSMKYINEEQIPLLFQSNSISAEMEIWSCNTNPSVRIRKAIATDYISAFIRNKHNDIDINMLNDYLFFAMQLGEKIDLNAGKKKLFQLHNEYSNRLMFKNNRGKKLSIPETPLKYLSLPKEFNRITTKKALYHEGQANDNCVGTYLDRINKGKCIIYSADISGEHLTIEIAFRKRKIFVKQCYKKYNQNCKEETYAYVVKCVENAAPQALKKYKQKGTMDF